MADDEVVTVEPTAIGTVTPAKTGSDELRAVGNVILSKVNIATNRTVTPPAAVQHVAPLREQTITGYKRGAAFPLIAIELGGVLVEKFTAYDFLLMKRAAVRDGITLNISNGYRTNETQAKLYAERVNPDGTLTAKGKKKGVAAKPGFSNHQAGVALDIHVNLTIAQRAAGDFSAEFLWLSQNADRFGFDNTEVPSEPWHWRHKAARIVGVSVEDEDYLLSLVTSQASGAVAIQATKTEGTQLLDRAIHETTKAQERSALMTRTTRSTLFAYMGREAVFRGSALTTKASRYVQEVANMETKPPTYTAETLKSVSYDFETGRWGDGTVT